MNHEYWYLSRAAGFTAYLLLFVSVALGIAIGTRIAERVAKRNTIFDLHRFTTILALAFSVFHVYILLGDQYFSFNVFELSIPFVSPYRTWETAAGVVSLYATIIIVASFYLRKHIGYRIWRALHFTTFAMYALVTYHSITAGTDTAEPWAKAIYVATGAATLALIAYRVQRHMPDSSGWRAGRLAAGMATVVVAAVLVFATGLLDGTSSAQTRAATDEAAARASASDDAHPFLASFDTNVTGTFTQTSDASTSHLIMQGDASGDVPLKLRIEVTQTNAPAASGGGAAANSTVTLNRAELLDPTTEAPLCEGALTALNGGTLRGSCDGMGPYSGVRIAFSSRVSTSASGTFTGAMSGTMQRTS